VRLYLSSFRLGNRPKALLGLLRGGTRTALVVNAGDYQSPADRAAARERELDELGGLGLDPFEVDLRDYFGRPDDLREVLAPVDLVYVRGGNAFVLRRAYRHSGADTVISELLACDAVVYAGYSAGPVMLGLTLDGIVGEVDDPSVVPPGYPDVPAIRTCLGVLPFAIVPHYRSNHPESVQMERTVEYLIDHHVPFIALRDGQVLVVDGPTTTVVG
jgi:dipeptidase E